MKITMSSSAFNRWAKRFRCEAMMDGAALLRDQLRRLELPDEPTKLVEGTILLVSTAAAYSANEGGGLKEFFAQQAYRPSLDPNTYYSFTFNLRDNTYGRVITPLTKKTLDLADLWGHPWHEFKMCGYNEIRISRLDNAELSDAECARIETAITDDIYFDFTEDEVDVVFDPQLIPNVLIAYFIDQETDVERID